MTVSTTISPILGIFSTVDSPSNTTPGLVTISGLQQATTALATGSTLTPSSSGLVTIAGGAASQVVMPLASSCAGAMFTVRAASAYAHFLTCSQEAAGTKAFTNGTSNGSKLALAAVVGSSVSLLSDGVNFLVLGNSGSLAFSGT